MDNERLTDGVFTLSPEQIRKWEEIQADRRAREEHFKIAMNYFHNQMNVEVKRRAQWWDDILDQFNLDKSTEWVFDSCYENRVVVRRLKKDEKHEP